VELGSRTFAFKIGNSSIDRDVYVFSILSRDLRVVTRAMIRHLDIRGVLFKIDMRPFPKVRSSQ
jgi:hypothetical protein